jgi:hypothetical protein
LFAPFLLLLWITSPHHSFTECITDILLICRVLCQLARAIISRLLKLIHLKDNEAAFKRKCVADSRTLSLH